MSGQIYCTVACTTSCSRMLFAFSRDGAVPGARLWAKVNVNGTPRNAVIASGVAGVVLTLPALYKAPNGAPVAFYAVVSIGVIGLYVAFAIPIWLRLAARRRVPARARGRWATSTSGWPYRRRGDRRSPRSTSCCRTHRRAIPGHKTDGKSDFAWTAVNYTPIVVIGALILLWIGWHLSAKKWFTGPKNTINLPAGVSSADEIALEHEHKGYLTGEHDKA